MIFPRIQPNLSARSRRHAADAPGNVEQIIACPLCHADITIPGLPESDDANFIADPADDNELMRTESSNAPRAADLSQPILRDHRGDGFAVGPSSCTVPVSRSTATSAGLVHIYWG
jgi:hypothetical protein